MDKSTFLKASVWSFLQQFGFTISNFVISIALARLLVPSDFGVIGIALVFSGFANIISDGGLASSLIRSKEVDETDYSTIFIANVVVSFVLYFLIFFSAPYIAEAFADSNLTTIIRVVTLSIIISSFTIIQSVRLTKELQFKKKLMLGLPALVISGIVGVYLAYVGFGVWSLIFKDLSFSVLLGAMLWIDSKWVPKLVFSYSKFKYHFNFGYKLLLTELLSKLFKDLYTIAIAKYFSTTQLGLYSRAKSMEELPNGIIFHAINRVMFPLLAQINDNDQRLKHVYSQIIKRVAYLLVPVLTIMLIFAEPLFIFLLTDKWAGAVPYFQILTCVALMSPLQSYNLNICKVKGRSDLILKLSIFKYILIALGVLIGIQFGMYGLLWALVAATFVEVLITGHFAGNLINYTLVEQLKDVRQPFAFSAVAGICTFFINYYWISNLESEFLILLVGSSIFVSLYLLLSYIFKNEILKIGIAVLLKRK